MDKIKEVLNSYVLMKTLANKSYKVYEYSRKDMMDCIDIVKPSHQLFIKVNKFTNEHFVIAYLYLDTRNEKKAIRALRNYFIHSNIKLNYLDYSADKQKYQNKYSISFPNEEEFIKFFHEITMEGELL